MKKKIIEIKKLVKYYGKTKVLNSLSFDVNEGEILGLLGPNGSGKSTTINCILSLLKFNDGSIKIFGEEMTPEAYEIKRNIGVVFQNVAVFEELTVYENINYFCGLYIDDKKLRKQYVMEAIELVGLNDFIKFYPKQLSGGLLRRLNIACGVSHKPKLIILDEPTVAVDPQSRNNILDGIKKLNNDGATIIYTTHYMEEVEQICNRIIIIDKGNIIASGTKEEIKESIGIKEKVTVKVDNLSNDNIEKIIKMKNVEHVSYIDNNLYVEFSSGNHNLINLLDYLKDNNYKCEKIFSELPTLNDVFLELTGKELRDNV